MRGLLHWSGREYDFDVAVIGAGSGGLTVAVGCQKLGLRTALIEGHLFGGDCLNFGCVPSKTLIASAAVAHTVRTARDFGIHTAEPETSWEEVKSRIESVKEEIRHHENAGWFRKMGMSVFEEFASFLDPHTLQVGDRRITARHIVIATGSRPAVPPIDNLQEVGFVTNETVFSMPEFPRRLGIIGAGPIGCELAQAFARLGSRVRMLGSADQVLDKEDADMAEKVAARLTAEGVTIACGAKVREVSRNSSGEKILRYMVNSTEQETAVDEILVATGRQPNSERLNLEAAGIETQRGAITTDERMRTSQEHIYAIGDVTGGLLFTHMASQQAGVVVRNMVFGLPAENSTAAFPWVTYVDPELASVGYNEKRARADGITYEAATASLHENDRARASGETTGCIKVLTSRGKIVGAQILASHAGEMIPEYVVAVSRGMRLRDMTSFTHAYPTFAELNKRVASDAVGRKLFSARVRGVLRLLYGYGAK